jgi:hypothetical protein
MGEPTPANRGGVSGRVASALLLALLYLAGIVFWYGFLRRGHMHLKHSDWPLTADAYAVLKQALEQGVVPFHTQGLVPDRAPGLEDPVQLLGLPGSPGLRPILRCPSRSSS